MLGVEFFRRARATDRSSWLPRPTVPLPDTVLACGAAMVLYVVALLVIGSWQADGDGPPSTLTSLLAGGGLNLVFALALLPSARHDARVETGTRRLVGAGLWTGVATFGVVHVVGMALIAVYALLGREVPTQEVVSAVREADGVQLVLAGVAAVVVAPVAEEVFFRGILLPAFGRFIPVAHAIVLQALVFGAFHFLGDFERLPLAIPLAVVGLAAGWLYVRTRSLLAVMVLHATFNAVHFGLLLASR